MDALVSSSSFLLRSSLPPFPPVASATAITTRPLSSTQLASAASNLQLLPFRSARRTRRLVAGAARPAIRCGSIKEIGESEFSVMVLESNRPVLVEFVATWCGPCRLIYSAMESLAQEYSDRMTVVKIDHDANPRLIEEYKVYGLPTFILFKNGKEVAGSRKEGAIKKEKLKEHIDNLLNTISVV